MTKYEIKKELDRLTKELELTSDTSKVWDKDIREAIVKLRHTMQASGSPCSCCGGSGVG
ncbi:hypothetical protein [Flagellimonas allohymeniacidonis]|uniref:hypothetical protein n=1 Tax=Flagellimonas allohymeniacidonis TaxID=2517819 RepID=UPI0013EEA22A|nr:hypothetical protein [Allomuricauda hymeniacidonis]